MTGTNGRVAEPQYRAREFAVLAGVTVRTLHHYDRVGLLKPLRTRAGHRTYQQQDFQRLRRILALKTLGVTLKSIAKLLEAAGPDLGDALAVRRADLVQQRRQLDGLIAAIDQVRVDIARRGIADLAVLERIVEALDMKCDDEEWAEIVRTTSAHRRSMAPETLADLGRQNEALLNEIQQVLGREPADPAVQALADRWVDLIRLANGPNVTVERVVRCGKATYEDALTRSPQHASSPWVRAIGLMNCAIAVPGRDLS